MRDLHKLRRLPAGELTPEERALLSAFQERSTGGLRSQPPGVAEVREVDEASRTVYGWLTTPAVDSYNESVDPYGGDLSRFRANPIALWGHNQRLPAIGTWRELQISEAGIAGGLRFATSQLADDLLALYTDGVLKGFSIGFFYKRAKAPDGSVDWGFHWDAQRGIWVAHAWELLECSAVNVPANPETLARAADEGNRAAELVLRSCYPDLEGDPPARQALPKAAVEAARLGEDLQRLRGAAEAIRNLARHRRNQQDDDGEPVAPPEAVHEAIRDLCEVVNLDPSDLLGRTSEPAQADAEPDPAATAAAEDPEAAPEASREADLEVAAPPDCSDPTPPEPDPAAGALSVDEARALRAELTMLHTQQSRLARLFETALAAQCAR